MENDENILIIESFIDFIIESNLSDRHNLKNLIDNVIEVYLINTIKQLYIDYENHKLWIDNEIEDAFDIENFIEIIDEYFTGFKSLNKSDILKWLVKLKKDIDLKNEKNLSKIDEPSIKIDEEKKGQENFEIKIESVKCNKKIKNDHTDDTTINLLVEIFPGISLKDINKIYKKTNGNYDKAIDNLLLLQNGNVVVVDEDEDEDDDNEDANVSNNYGLTDDEKKILKEKTIKKYFFLI